MAFQHVVHILNNFNLYQQHFSILNLQYKSIRENEFLKIQSLKNFEYKHRVALFSMEEAKISRLKFLKILDKKPYRWQSLLLCEGETIWIRLAC